MSSKRGVKTALDDVGRHLDMWIQLGWGKLTHGWGGATCQKETFLITQQQRRMSQRVAEVAVRANQEWR